MMRPMAGSIARCVLSQRRCCLSAAGGRVKFTVYSGVGHNAWDAAYADSMLYE